MGKYLRKRFGFRNIYGKDHEKGAILPLSFGILLLFSYALLHLALLYETEKSFFQLVERRRYLETILFHGVKDVTEIIPPSGEGEDRVFYYDVGFVHFHILSMDSTSVMIEVYAELSTGENMIAHVRLDLETGDVLEWKEKLYRSSV